MKFNSSGVRQWGTYYGGTDRDMGYSCITDTSGNICLTGYAYSTSGISTIGSHQTAFGGGKNDAFLVKFNSSGVRQWGTYYGGTGREFGQSLATDSSGNIIVSGNTTSRTGIATTGAHQTLFSRAFDAFLVKFNSNGVRQWGTYYGGTGYEDGSSCANDASGNIYLAGQTYSTSGIAKTCDYQAAFGGVYDAYLVKFNSNGVRQWGTYYGGTGYDIGYSCATDTSGNVYLSGYTSSTSVISTTGAHQTAFGGVYDAFLVKFTSTYCSPVFSQDSIVSCDSYTWIDGVTYTASNISVKDTLCNSNGCDSIVSLNLTINYSNTSIDSIVSCDSYTWIDSVTYTASDTSAKDTLSNLNGCDSIVSLYLTINYTKTFTDSIVSCDSYTWIDGVTYTSNNTSVKDTLVTTNGCDSIVSLNLTINYTKTFTDSIVSCSSYTWINGVTYTASNTSVKDTLTARNGCDSIVSLNLTINYAKTYTDSIAACNSYTWINGVTYTDDNTSAIDTLVTTNGCDSIVSLKLTINSTKTYTDSIVACDSYTWIDGFTYTDDNTSAIDTRVTTNGCDSIVSLNLTINYTKTFIDSIVANDNYSWINGVTYTLNNTTATDTLAASNGCDSIVSLNLTIVSTAGIDNPATLSDVTVYPNPTSGKLTIEAKNFEGVKVYDVLGRLLIKSKLNTISLEDQSKGLYLLKVNANGVIQEFKVFKE